MVKVMLLAGLSAGLMVAPNAFAGRYVEAGAYFGGPGPGPAYSAPGYGYGAPEQVEYARVVNTQPVYQTVRVDQPRQECWNEQVAYRDQHYDNNVAAGGIIGAIAGGVLGHQFGAGGGRVLATGLGAVVGANVGANTAAANTPYEQRVGYQQRCRTVADSHYEDRVDAYDVTYQYGGRLYTTRMPYDPGERIAINVDVRPRAY